LAQIERTKGCASPIWQRGHSDIISAATGEILHRYSSESEPGGRVALPCGNRRRSRCPACSALYRDDVFHLHRAGLIGGKTIPETVRQHPKVFVTFTAPSFGPVHHRTLDPDGRPKRCHPRPVGTGGRRLRCGRRHDPGDPAIGQPLDPDSYDYAGQVLWNALAPKLWAETTKQLARALAAAAGYSQRVFATVGRRSFGKVIEYQARGAIHYHAVIRLDGVDPDSPDTITTPGRWADIDTLTQAITAAANRATVTAPDGRVIRWGRQLEIDRSTIRPTA
jgi:hypothetical protein